MTESEMQTLAAMVADIVANKVSQKLQTKFLGREEFAAANGISAKTVDRAIAQGRLDYRREGRRVLIPATAEIRPRVDL